MFFMCFFCLTPLGLEYSRSRKTVSLISLVGKMFAPNINLRKNLHLLYIHCFLMIDLLTFFLISVKMDRENKVIGFQFEPERSISDHKGFFQDSSDEGTQIFPFKFFRNLTD